jgi:hypothetical protein
MTFNHQFNPISRNVPCACLDVRDGPFDATLYEQVEYARVNVRPTIVVKIQFESNHIANFQLISAYHRNISMT